MLNMDIREIKAIIEALLFTWGDSLNLEDISNIIELDMVETQEILSELIDEFNYNRRGLRIIKANDSYQICTRPEHFAWIKKLNNSKPNRNLSNASLETLSIIAYKQPITKIDIENIRGVKSDKAMETLLDKGLICELGRLEKTGRPIIYGTTEEFLKLFSLTSLEELPDIEGLEDREEIKENI